MVLGGSTVTVASNSLVHSLLNITLYPLLLALLSIDILFSEEIRDPGKIWKRKLGILQTLRIIFNVLLLIPAITIMTIAAIIGTLAMFTEKCVWIALEIVTVRLLSYTSLSRGNQELMELIGLIIPFLPTKEIRLNIAVSSKDISSSGYREPYIERGTWSQFFLIQFEFPDPRLRDEASSIIAFHDASSFWPVCTRISERRVLILSPLGWVETLNVVKALKLYTDEHSTQASHSIKSRWHGIQTYFVRELHLIVTRADCNEKNKAHVYWVEQEHRCISSLTIGTRDPMLQLLPDIFRDLNLLPDMARSTRGQVYISGVALCKLLLSIIVTSVSIAHVGLENVSKSRGLDGYAVILALWALLFAWGFEPFFGPTVTTIDNIVSNNKMAVLFSIAHDNGDLLFRDSRCSWAIKALRGSHSPPTATKAELFLATHSVVMSNEILQTSMSDAMVSRGKVVASREGNLVVSHWKDIYRRGGYEGRFEQRATLVS